MAAILVLRLSSLGDIVLASSFLQSCREHFPEARLDCVVREDFVALATALPGVARVIAVSRRAGPLQLLAVGASLAREPYEHVFDLHQSLRSRLLTWRLRRRLRPGFSKQELPRWLLVHAHRDVYHRFGGVMSMRERMLEPLRRLGLSPRLHDTRLVLSADDRARAAALLGPRDGGRSWIAVAPGARWPSKRWPVDRFAALLARLAAVPERRFVLLGAATERPFATTVAAVAPAVTLDACGLDILETAAVLEHCQLCVGNDSGLAHVAEALGCPVLTFFGPTAPAFGYAPYRAGSRALHRPPPCNPCSKNGSRPCHRPTHECMENISVDEASAVATAILESAR